MSKLVILFCHEYFIVPESTLTNLLYTVNLEALMGFRYREHSKQKHISLIISIISFLLEYSSLHSFDAVR